MEDNKIKSFMNEEFGEVRTVTIDGIVYFVAKDIAVSLKYTNTNKAIKDHCKKAIMAWGNDSLGRRQEYKVIPKSDIYRLIVRSKLPDAEEFESWLFEEVLPQIEMTGGYIPISEEDSPELIMAKALKIAEKTIHEKDAIISELQPKAQAYSDLMDSEGWLQFLDVSGMVEIGRTKLMDFLRKNKVLTRQSNYNVPYGRFRNNGMFKVVVEETRHGKVGSVTLVSPRGLHYIYKLINKKNMQDEFDLEKLVEVQANA
jgi:anti-repressor protein